MQTIVIIPSNLQAELTGARQCNKGKRKTELVYADGSIETVKTSKIPETINWENWFSVVGSIQSLRK